MDGSGSLTPASVDASSQATAQACAECHKRPVPNPRKGARFCSGKCRTVASRRDRSLRAYGALAAAIPGGSKLWPKGVDPARLAGASPLLLAALERSLPLIEAHGTLGDYDAAQAAIREARQ